MNCAGDCKHHQYVENGHRHKCEKNPEGFDNWLIDHWNHTFQEYKKSIMECYEPSDKTE